MACARWGGDCAAQVAPLARAIESVTVKTLPGGRKEQVGRRGWTPSLPPKRLAVASTWAALADDRPLPRCGRGATCDRRVQEADVGPALAGIVATGWRGVAGGRDGEGMGQLFPALQSAPMPALHEAEVFLFRTLRQISMLWVIHTDWFCQALLRSVILPPTPVHLAPISLNPTPFARESALDQSNTCKIKYTPFPFSSAPQPLTLTEVPLFVLEIRGKKYQLNLK